MLGFSFGMAPSGWRSGASFYPSGIFKWISITMAAHLGKLSGELFSIVSFFWHASFQLFGLDFTQPAGHTCKRLPFLVGLHGKTIK
jgi:hypothetical protein